MKTVPPKGPRARFRRAREAAGFSQIGLSRFLERSTAYVAHIENGRLNPCREERAKLAGILGVAVDELFAGFPKLKAEKDEELGHQILNLCGEYSDGEIAKRLGVGRGKVRGRRIIVGGATRPNMPMLARQLAGEGKLTANAAGLKHGFDPPALRKAIDDERIRGEKMRGPFGPHKYVYVVNEAEFLEDLERLPFCRFEGCERRAFARSGCCSGAHARGLETRGEWWATGDGQRFLGEYAAGSLRPTCWLCGSEKTTLALAHFAKAWREDRRLVCEVCGPVWVAALIRARSRARLASSPMGALERALEVADEFERDLRARRSKEGRPRAFAVDLVIEALFIGRGLSRAQVLALLNRAIREGRLPMLSDEVGGEYVRTRQKRAKIKKRQRAPS